MKINAPKEEYIFIELNRSDMEKLHLSYAEMDYSNEETRKAIYSVLREAKLSLGQNFELSDTLKVEALPRDDGGCLLFFTISEKTKKYRFVSNISEIVYRFDNIDALIDLSAAMRNSERLNINSNLILDGKKYYLTLRGRLRHSLIMKMNEYAYPVKREETASFSEKNLVIADNALDVLCGGTAK